MIIMKSRVLASGSVLGFCFHKHCLKCLEIFMYGPALFLL